MKRCPTSLGKCKLKQDITTHLLKCPKKKKTGNKNDGNDVEQQEILLIADGNAKYCSHFGRHFGIFLQR